MNFESPYVNMTMRLRVRQNLNVFGMLYGCQDVAGRIGALADELDLHDFLDRQTGKLSSGQKTRVALAKSLINARADRCLWGTNWPHPGAARGPITQVTPYQVVDNPRLVSAFMEWCPDAAMRKMILVDTPARLYRFPAA